MNIPLFLRSLTALEQAELRNYFLMHPEIITTKDFLKKYEMSVRLRSILDDNSGDLDVFRYISEINKTIFLKLTNAGEVTWIELEKLLTEHYKK